jgi:hypothetical protein
MMARKLWVNIKKWGSMQFLYRDEFTITRYKSYLLLFAWVLFLTKGIWGSSGCIVFSDLDFGMNDKKYIERMLGIFNEGFSSTNFFNLSRLAFTFPLWLISNIFTDYIEGFLLKLIIVAVVVISAFGMYRLCDSILNLNFGKLNSPIQYYAMIIPALYYALNPWVIIRIQHIFLLVGYAFFPWILKYFFILFSPVHYFDREEGMKNLSFFGFEFTIKKQIYNELLLGFKTGLFIMLGAAAIHYFFYYALTIGAYSILICIYMIYKTKRIKETIWLFLRRNIMIWGSTVVLCAYWLFPYVFAMLVTQIEPNNVNVLDTIQMFSRNSTLQNIVYLISYWWPMFDTEILLNDYFWRGGAIFLFMIIYIILYRYNMHFLVTLFSTTAILLIFLAFGVNSEFFAGVTLFVVTKVPIIGHIFRDPNKILGPMAVFFGILISFAIDRYLFLFKRSGYGIVVKFSFLFLLLMAHYYFIAPFDAVFFKSYYSGVEIPKEYRIVNEKLDKEKGKVLWIPNMDSMVLSNGVASYIWNEPKGAGEMYDLIKPSGDFHFYSSSKNGIFQHENNDGIVSLMYYFLQYMLDSTGGQHLDSLIAWLGFDQVVYHKDVASQEERQVFNLGVMEHQKDLKKIYQDKYFSLYNVKYATDGLYGSNQIVYHTKDLFSFLYAMDDKDENGLVPNTSGLIWAQQKNYNGLQLDSGDILIGDNKLDFVMPLVKREYFVYPFDYINRGNPSLAWAKTLLKEAEWQWILKYNNLGENLFQYDYSKGIAYTYVAKRERGDIQDKNRTATIINTVDIMNGFFKADNPDILNLTVFPGESIDNVALSGSVKKGYSGNNMWQIAKSKMVDVSEYQGLFLSVEAVASGINAQNFNFKIHYFNKDGDVLKNAYVVNPINNYDFKEEFMFCDSYIPIEAVKMRIDILNNQDTVLDTHFWVHEFKVFVYMKDIENNTLEVKIPVKSDKNRYRVFFRGFFSKLGDELKMITDVDKKVINLEDKLSKFKWIDCGELNSNDGDVIIYPKKDGLSVINSVVFIPVEKYKEVYENAEKSLTGRQFDYANILTDYYREIDYDARKIEELKVFPNTIKGDILLVNKGKVKKEIDILKDGRYQFLLTGNIKSSMSVKVEWAGPSQSSKYFKNLKKNQIKRGFQEEHYNIKYEKDKYYLRREDNEEKESWRIYEYDLEEYELKKGKYTVSIEFNDISKNLIKNNSLHQLEVDEIIIPDEIKEQGEDVISVYAQPKIQEEVVGGKIVLKNTPSKSKLWIIYAENKVPVKKGQILGYHSLVKTRGLEHVHGKILFMDEGRVLNTSVYTEYDPTRSDLSQICVVPEDGFAQPVYFMRSDGVEAGTFSIEKTKAFILDEISKIEGTKLISKETGREDIDTPQIKSKGFSMINVKDTRMLVHNEAYNPIWMFASRDRKEPVICNFIHNGFLLNGEEYTGVIMMNPLLVLVYIWSLMSSIIIAIIGFMRIGVDALQRRNLEN